MILSDKNIFVFDLDDTLYPEREFERSGIEFVYQYFEIKHIALNTLLANRNKWINLINNGIRKDINDEVLLNIYRNHFPDIMLYNDSHFFLEKLLAQKAQISLITDGRSITQRNKLKALGIESFFKQIVISEEINSAKPAERNFKLIMGQPTSHEYVYIADNPAKDFITPNKLGWITICILDKGQNVHKQNFNLSSEFMPKFKIKSFDEIILSNET